MDSSNPHLPYLAPGQAFPDVNHAWGLESAVPGLLAAGGDLNVESLVSAYRSGIFPWFGEGQPILWWSPNPRMVLGVENFRMHRSLLKTIKKFSNADNHEIRVDTAFVQVIKACAATPRGAAVGTWILPEMVDAYVRLHLAGHAHSVETWINGRLVGGLYCVVIGKAVFGESMFSLATDASKIALSALVCICRRDGIAMIDCQQNTAHLASLGAFEIDRGRFLRHVKLSQTLAPVSWQFDPLYWTEIFSSDSVQHDRPD